MDGHALKNGVEFLKLESFGCVLAVFCGHVAGGAGHSACLMLGALENHLHAGVFAFLCHFEVRLEVLECQELDFIGVEVAFADCFLHGGIQTELVDGAQAGGRNCEHNPHALFYPIELLVEEVNVEFALGTTLRV